MNPVADKYLFSRGQGLGVRHFQTLLLFFEILCISNTWFPLYLLDDKIRSKSYWESFAKKDMTEFISGKIFFEVIFLIFSGFISSKINNKFILLSCVFLNSSLQYAYPALLQYTNVLFYIDFITDILNVMQLPCLFNTLPKWLSTLELSYMVPLIISAIDLSTFLMFSLAKDLRIAGGESAFHYFFANCGLIWCIAYGALGSSGPESCWYISAEEKKHILNSLHSKAKGHYRKHVPWRGILTCLPLYMTALSLLSIHLAINCYFYYISIPIALHFDSLHPHILMELQSLFNIIIVIPLVWLTTYLITNNKVSLKTLRYTLSSIGQWGAAISYLLLSNSHGLVDFVIFGVLGPSFCSIAFLVVMLNFFDLSQNYVGLIVTLAYVFRQFWNLLSTIVFQHLLNTFELDIAWRAIFFTSAVILLLSNFFFTTYGSVEVQKFDTLKEYDSKGSNL